MKPLKITQVGNSLGVILSREVLSKLRSEKGDKLFVIETPEGIELRSYDPEFSEQMDLASELMKENRDVLRKLSE